MTSEREERIQEDKDFAEMEQEKYKKELKEIDDSLRAHTKLLHNWKDEIRMEQEKQIAIMRNIVREETRVDALTIKQKELQEKIAKDEPEQNI